MDRTEAARYLTGILDLRHHIAAVRFLEFPEDYDRVAEFELKGTISALARKAVDGFHFKVDAERITDSYGQYALGIRKPDITVTSGHSFYQGGLYADRATAREAAESLDYIPQEITGLEFGDIRDVQDPDVIFLICEPEQAMRIIQGYAYHHGEPERLGLIGNQGISAELIARPYMRNDISLSLLCGLSRQQGQFAESELGIGMPADLFLSVADGVIRTTNAVLNDYQKQKMLDRFKKDQIDLPELEITFKSDSVRRMDEYDQSNERRKQGDAKWGFNLLKR